jgi:Domain of Unknown Function with PDB structure (DUF3857)
VSSLLHRLSEFSFVCVLLCAAAFAQEPAAKPPDATPPGEKAAAAKSEEKPSLPFQVQLLETRVGFAENGDSRKEVHTIVKINDLAGARQFSRLGFDYNRAFQQVEIPLVKISHSNGGTSEILPSAVTDAPNPAVQDFPAYHDIRVKSVRILGLQDGDTIEYRVITTTTKPPLAPDFWLEHTFDRSGQVLEEDYSLTLPLRLVRNDLESSANSSAPSPPLLAKPRLRMYVSPETPKVQARTIGDDLDHSLIVYSWKITPLSFRKDATESLAGEPDNPNVVITTYTSWTSLAGRLSHFLATQGELPKSLQKKLDQVVAEQGHSSVLAAIYDFVSREIRTVDLPLGSSGFRTRSPAESFADGYAIPEDKIALLSALLHSRGISSEPLLVPASLNAREQLPRPSLFRDVLIRAVDGATRYTLDPTLEVAPLGMVKLAVRGTRVLAIEEATTGTDDDLWTAVPRDIPFAARQDVSVKAAVSVAGDLSAVVKYTLRGDNELVLRMAFHQTPKERWKEVAGLLALSDGFRGTITDVTASDPMATKEPFTVEYELTQAKFVDWSKKPVRIPALLPQIALPDAPGKTAAKIELGTPLDVQTSLTLKLPEGTTVQTPAATSVARDYATFASKYDGHLNTVTASRHIHFVMREMPIERAGDYNTFLRAVQNDQAQVIVLSPSETRQENRKGKMENSFGRSFLAYFRVAD